MKDMRQIDPVINWPNNAPPLRPMIAEMQPLNLSLGLRGAVRDDDSEYLLYDRTAFDVVRIAMPAVRSRTQHARWKAVAP
jgi:hypothetical protein